MQRFRLGLFLFAATVVTASQASAQAPTQSPAPWQMQDSGSTASLRGIDTLNGTIAWASGSGGTVLRTIDGGQHWLPCAIPDAATDGATLDFRGVQAFGASTAIVMASGPGDKSRLYETTDGCKSWRLIFRNPNAPDGFFDGFWLNGNHGMVLGDPVDGRFAVFTTDNSGKTWKRDAHVGLAIKDKSLAAFAASNSSIARGGRYFALGFATGGKDGAQLFSRPEDAGDLEATAKVVRLLQKKSVWKTAPIAVKSGTASSGVFAIGYRYPVTSGICPECTFAENSRFIAVGGDYTKPNEAAGTAAWSADGGQHWTASTIPPHGYRSSVQWSDALKLWIAAGTNGSDISRDEGKTWAPLDNGNWNALSLPFVVGPNGRVARLNPAAISAAK